MTRTISKAGGSRQRVWDVLRAAKRPLPAREIATRADTNLNTVWGYLTALKQVDYVSNVPTGQNIPDHEGWILEKNTGPRSPSVEVNREFRFHDWNLNPPMSGRELRRAFKVSGLSMNQFGVAVGLGENNGTRLRQMMDGYRPVSPKVEEGAKKLARKKQ